MSAHKEIIDKWFEEHQGKHFCKCGCGQVIKITRDHYQKGVPKYIRYHCKEFGKRL